MYSTGEEEQPGLYLYMSLLLKYFYYDPIIMNIYT